MEGNTCWSTLARTPIGSEFGSLAELPYQLVGWIAGRGRGTPNIQTTKPHRQLGSNTNTLPQVPLCWGRAVLFLLLVHKLSGLQTCCHCGGCAPPYTEQRLGLGEALQELLHHPGRPHRSWDLPGYQGFLRAAPENPGLLCYNL